MSGLFGLKGPVAHNLAVDEGDTVTTKKALSQLGHYELPKWGVTPYPDTEMFDGLKSFQRSQGLAVDGLMKKDGPTARLLDAALWERGARGTGKKAASGTGGRPILSLRGAIGGDARARPRDVQTAKRALAWAGVYPPEGAQAPTGEADPALDSAIRVFQDRYNLKRDGLMRPNGPTARMLNRAIRPAVTAHLEKTAPAHGLAQSIVAPPERQGWVGTGGRRQRGTLPEPKVALNLDGERGDGKGAVQAAPGSETMSGEEPRQDGPRRRPPGEIRPRDDIFDDRPTVREGAEKNTDGTGNRRPKDTISLPDPKDDTPVDGNEMYRRLRFDPQGKGEYERAIPNSIQHLKNTFEALDTREYAEKSMEAQMKAGNLPRSRPHNNAADAYRHTLWSYKVARDQGGALAKAAGDAHEITVVNTEGERLMDLYNNEVGRQLAANPKNHDRPDEEVILEALRQGKLRERVFVVGKPGDRRGVRNDIYKSEKFQRYNQEFKPYIQEFKPYIQEFLRYIQKLR